MGAGALISAAKSTGGVFTASETILPGMVYATTTGGSCCKKALAPGAGQQTTGDSLRAGQQATGEPSLAGQQATSEFRGVGCERLTSQKLSQEAHR